MTLNKDLIELLHTTGLYIPTRTIVEVGPVDEDMLDRMLKNLHALDSTVDPINIKLSSEGGCVVSARGIYDAIKACKNLVRIICYGEVASSATLILQAADERVMTDNSKLMLHVGSEGIAHDHPRNVDAAYEENRKLEKWMEDIYLDKIKQKKKRFTRQNMKTMLTWDRSLTPEEAMSYGLIDIIGEVQ